MGEAANRLPDLDVLTGKVYQAKELISRLRQSNRELSSRLGEIKRRFETQESVIDGVEADPQAGLDVASPPDSLAGEVERLRKERLEIRERVSHLLKQIESLDI
jgi:hypothetical protein